MATKSKKRRPRASKQVATCRVCTKPPHRRGLCRSCYGGFLRDLDAKKFTDEEAVKAGLVDPPLKPGPKPPKAWDERVAQLGLGTGKPRKS